MPLVAFTVEDLKDLTRILLERPEWLSEVRRIVLTDELLTLPALARELVEFQRRANERFAELVQAIAQLALRLEQLAEAQRRIEEQLAEFQRRTDERFAQLAEAQRRIEEQLAESQRRTDERFAQLAEAQRRTDEQLAEFQRRTDERLAELAEFQRQADGRFAELAQAIAQLTLRFEQLAEAQRKTDERLAEFQRRTDERFAELAQAISRLAAAFEQEMAEVRGKLLEIDYRNKVGAIFGSRIRKPQVVDPGDVWDLFRDRLDELEIRQIVTADLIVRGRLLPSQGERELWLAVEISSVIDRNDVARAAARAALLRKAGLLAVPVAAGRRLTQGASVLASELRVVLARNGGLAGWDEALSQVLA
jgi:hypothetical protein